MFLVSGRVRRRLAVGLGFSLALASIGPGVAIACEGVGEEHRSRVLTVETAGGPEAVVGDTVKAVLYSAKSQFIMSAGEIACSKSEMAGGITSNPVSGGGSKAEIQLGAFTFSECNTNILGLTVKGVTIQNLPVIAETVGTTELFITEKLIGPSSFGVEFTIERGGAESICLFSTLSLDPRYRNNNNGEIEISQELKSFFNKSNCGSSPLTYPTWTAAYRPLQDETGVRAGKQIFIN